MPGLWLTRLAHRLLHDDTFEIIVSPAIADLQFEVAAGRASLRSYAGVWAALAGALAHDFGGDVHTMLDDAPMLASLVCIQACYYTSLLVIGGSIVTNARLEQFVPAPGGFVAALAAVLVATAALSVVPTLLCFWPERRCSSC
jgi:hypothetical protein